MESTFLRKNSILQGLLSGTHLLHAYIVNALNMEGEQIARELAKCQICSAAEERRPCGICAHCRKVDAGIHPDIIIVDRETDKREIRIEQIRAIRADAAVMPNEAEKKVYIIQHADTMNIPSQNAMLNILEEPPVHAVFILVAENVGMLLPTVRSRCVEIVPPPQKVRIEIEDERVENFSSLAMDSDAMGLLTLLSSMEQCSKAELTEFIYYAKCSAMTKLQTALRNDDITGKKRAFHIIHTLDRTSVFSDANVSVGHILGYLLAELV